MESGVYSDEWAARLGRVEWKTIRSAFIRARELTQLKQDAFAARAGLRQGDISKIESNDKRGPTVGNFVKAVEKGLKMPVSEFFRQIEAGQPPRNASVNTGVNPAISRAIVDVGQGHPIPGLSKKTHEELAEWHWARAAEAAAAEQLGAKIRRASRRKAGGD